MFWGNLQTRLHHKRLCEQPINLQRMSGPEESQKNTIFSRFLTEAAIHYAIRYRRPITC